MIVIEICQDVIWRTVFSVLMVWHCSIFHVALCKHHHLHSANIPKSIFASDYRYSLLIDVVDALSGDGRAKDARMLSAEAVLGLPPFVGGKIQHVHVRECKFLH